ncbi:outer membrane chaperone Skp (OmpH) [Emticicia oligotrophica DSM 17448]|uniref:Outer membrane chaperone Skp (OmpH) n=1 Tax=Emticicia oligotrophica (strain DSM 17448 / CIP 109782 / MTCC 6937 / GPTSA100-15) TaxID=929562 RepID=A0ABN4AKN2_EMTOG|nr:MULTISPECIES: OmpH family outer membrane protein [Emticicia]AFK02846.1 outer membrane chaperone Skp (OmpH) [Emticicia oligotrophica DSM 17448]
MKKTVLVAIILLFSQLGFSQASKPATKTSPKPAVQGIKLAYVYEDYILQNLKETKNLQAELASKRVSFETKLEQKAKVYQEEYAIYQAMMKDVTNLTTDSLNAKLKKVQNLKKEAEDFQANSQAELQKLAQDKFFDIREKTNAAIKAVAAEKGYKFVFRRNMDASSGESNITMLYSADNGKDDLTDAVLIKMGTVPPKKD